MELKSSSGLIYRIKFVFIRFFIKCLALLSVVIKESRKKEPYLDNTRFSAYYSELPEKETTDDLIKVFTKIFSEHPWYEKWEKNDVQDKLDEEIKFTNNSFLVIMKGDSILPVCGFSWGAILSVELLPSRIEKALKIADNSFENLVVFLKQRGVQKIIYFDEFAIDSSFRRGITPIRYLLLAGLKMGYKDGVYQTMFWTTPESKIMALSILMGYEPILKKDVRGKEVVFMFNPSGSSLLKIAENIGDKYIKFFMKIVSSVFRG